MCVEETIQVKFNDKLKIQQKIAKSLIYYKDTYF